MNKKYLISSISIHAVFFLVLSYWVCPWVERVVPQRHAEFDVAIIDSVNLAQESTKPRALAPKKTSKPTPASASADLAAGQISSAIAKTPQLLADQVETELEAGQKQTLTIRDYLNWVRSHNASPNYPRLSRMRGENGRVLILIEVRRQQSQVERATLVESSGYEALDQEALKTAAHWYFPPFNSNDEVLKFKLPFKFSLN